VAPVVGRHVAREARRPEGFLAPPGVEGLDPLRVGLVGSVRRGEAEPEEERAGLGGLAAQELQGVVREDLLGESGNGLGLRGDATDQLGVAVFGAAVRQPGPHLIESALPGGRRNVPLADHDRAVASVPQQARHGGALADGLGDSRLLVLDRIDAVAPGRQAGEQADADRMALGDRDRRLPEVDTVPRHAVHHGGDDRWVAGGTQGVPTMIVREHDDEIGPRRHLIAPGDFGKARQRQKQHRRQEASNARSHHGESTRTAARASRACPRVRHVGGMKPTCRRHASGGLKKAKKQQIRAFPGWHAP